jgi:hypothetical protein
MLVKEANLDSFGDRIKKGYDTVPRLTLSDLAFPGRMI